MFESETSSNTNFIYKDMFCKQKGEREGGAKAMVAEQKGLGIWLYKLCNWEG